MEDCTRQAGHARKRWLRCVRGRLLRRFSSHRMKPAVRPRQAQPVYVDQLAQDSLNGLTSRPRTGPLVSPPGPVVTPAADKRTGRFDSRHTIVRTTSWEQPSWRPISRNDRPFALGRR